VMPGLAVVLAEVRRAEAVGVAQVTDRPAWLLYARRSLHSNTSRTRATASIKLDPPEGHMAGPKAVLESLGPESLEGPPID
jgi:hypothetical protein